MKNPQNKRTIILAVILVGLLILAYKTMFVQSDGELISDEEIAASQRVADTLREIERISFDISIMEDQNFRSLISIEIPQLSLPVGRTNPFSGIVR